MARVKLLLIFLPIVALCAAQTQQESELGRDGGEQTKDDDYYLMVALDKVVYKAGDRVMFRGLLFYHKNPVPARVQNVAATLKDAYGEIVESKTDIPFKNGADIAVFENAFLPLPFKRNYRDWTVEVVTTLINGQRLLKIQKLMDDVFADELD
ncbi:uncharacterized protein LOC129598588 [Paramacrobiotus metropolitanus]|uniref:uncharacterized protein LOC129598588 n=1 Tax=Paramacrobiotus metropolitanus TaxID=2943436 RepID=UPI00244582FC|nr:uncharacterized protein LOC129598588 [Paramacrobiotus metropolitanus]